MSDQKLVLDLSGLTVESVEVVPAGSLDSATYGRGMAELGASCDGPFGGSSCFMPEELEGV